MSIPLYTINQIGSYEDFLHDFCVHSKQSQTHHPSTSTLIFISSNILHLCLCMKSFFDCCIGRNHPNKTNQSDVIVFFVVVVCLHALMNDYYLLCAPLFLTHRRKNTIPKRLTDRRGKIRPFTETSSFRKTQVSIRIHGTTLLLFYIVAILLLFTTAACLVTTGTG